MLLLTLGASFCRVSVKALICVGWGFLAGSSQPLPSGPVSMGTGVSSVGEASQAKTSRLKPRAEECRGRNVEDFEGDSAKNTPDSDKVKGDARQPLPELDSPLECLVPRALHAELGLGSGVDVAPAVHSGGEEVAAHGSVEHTMDVAMPIPPHELLAEDRERDAPSCGGGDTAVADEDNIVLKLRAEIAALRGQGPCSSSLKREGEKETGTEFGHKGVVRKVPPFQVCEPDNEGLVKTRAVAKVTPTPKATVVTTRNMAKGDKVRTRGDGPAKEVDNKKRGAKKGQKRQKVDVPTTSPGEEDEDDGDDNEEPQLTPAKVKRTGRR